MANLLEETKEAIEGAGKTIDEIIFIGSEQTGHQCNWEEFCVLADRDYDGGYGGQEVASDLIVVFSDKTKMWRGEYDGSEWWEYSTPFEMPKERKKIKSLFAKIGWECVGDCE